MSRFSISDTLEFMDGFDWVASAVLGGAIYLVIGILYRLFLHPLRRYPGPILASTTSWHMFYYNYICRGAHSAKIQQWHEQYGPIVRIGPNEIHFSDPEAYKAIYSHPSLQKDPKYYSFMTEGSLVGHLTTSVHKPRRKIFSRFFSPSSIRGHGKAEGILTGKADKLRTALQNLCQPCQTQAIVNITNVSKCFTYDIISALSFRPSDELTNTSPTFKSTFATANEDTPDGLWLLQMFPWIQQIINLPDAILKLLFPNVLGLKSEKLECLKFTRLSRKAMQSIQRVDICSQLATKAKNRRRVEISDHALGEEIFDFLVAGTELPANSIAFGIFHVTRNPRISQRLREELQGELLPKGSQMPSLARLEQLPYLTAVVNETLRLGNLVPGRLPRLTPTESIDILGHPIPGGIAVSASMHLTHMNPTIFPEPEKFIPERWLRHEDGSFASKLNPNNYLFAFSVGSRQCIGSNLALAEIRLALAVLFSGFDVTFADPDDYTQDLTWRDNIVASYDRDVRLAIRRRGH